MKQNLLQIIAALTLSTSASTQVNSGSDGAFNPTTNIVIDMANHPVGICHLRSLSPHDTI